MISHYQTLPGVTTEAAPRWPSHTQLAHDKKSAYHLILFAHPHCSCTRATLEELERLIAQCHPHLSVDILFYSPMMNSWKESVLTRTAARLPSVRISWDKAGQEADAFGARTSGYAVVYDRRGFLRYQGGLTIARGHDGTSPGRQIIISLVRGMTVGPFVQSAPTFGCPIKHLDETEGNFNEQ